MKNFDEDIKRIMDEILSDGTTDQIIKEKLTYGIEKAIAASFAYGKLEKAVKERVEQVLVPFIEEYDMNAYIVKLDTILTEIVNNSTLVDNKKMLENFKFLMEEPQIEEIKLTDLFEEYKKFVAKNMDTYGREVEWDSGEPEFCKIGSLQKWSDKKITWGGLGKRDMYKNITAKEFLGKNECIVIYRNKNETIALNKATKEKAVAKCSPSDTYDFAVGAKLALERLTEKEEKSEFKPHLSLYGKSCGIIGENTPFKDVIGRNLRVGDTVELYDKNNKYSGEYAVACEEEAFVMGIKCSCRKDGAVVNGWKLLLKRRHEEISNGEIVNEVLYVKEEAID